MAHRAFGVGSILRSTCTRFSLGLFFSMSLSRMHESLHASSIRIFACLSSAYDGAAVHTFPHLGVLCCHLSYICSSADPHDVAAGVRASPGFASRYSVSHSQLCCWCKSCVTICNTFAGPMIVITPLYSVPATPCVSPSLHVRTPRYRFPRFCGPLTLPMSPTDV